MKLLWFHLMPYTELPEDFRQKHPSVWVDIHSSLFDPKRAHLMYNDFMDEMEFAADCGFDAVCCNEHHSNGYGLMPSPNLIASASARRTRDTAICVMGNSLALYNPPTRVAEEFAMIDCISGGRLIAGFPVGTPMDTCYCYGQNPSLLRERYLEAHDLVMRAWQEPDTFAFNGRFNQQRYVNIWPRPVQRPHPPVWIPGGGSIETWQWCARMDYVYAYLSYFGYKDGRATMDGFWAEMARLGKDRNPYRAGFLQFVGVAETREKAMELYREPAEYFYGRCLYTDSRWATPPGYVTEGTMRAGMQSQVGRAASLAAREQARNATRDGGHRRARLRHHRLAGRGGGTAHRGGDDAERRAPDVAAAVWQHEQGADQVQHQAVRRGGDAEAEAAVRRMGRPLVAAADGHRAACRGAGVRAGSRRGVAASPRERRDPRGERCGMTAWRPVVFMLLFAEAASMARAQLPFDIPKPATPTAGCAVRQPVRTVPRRHARCRAALRTRSGRRLPAQARHACRSSVYSPGFAQAEFVWDDAHLDAWLTNPQKLIPGAVMRYRQADPKIRGTIIAWLKEQH